MWKTGPLQETSSGICLRPMKQWGCSPQSLPSLCWQVHHWPLVSNKTQQMFRLHSLPQIHTITWNGTSSSSLWSLWQWQVSSSWQSALVNFPSVTDCQYPSDKLMQCVSLILFAFPSKNKFNSHDRRHLHFHRWVILRNGRLYNGLLFLNIGYRFLFYKTDWSLRITCKSSVEDGFHLHSWVWLSTLGRCSGHFSLVLLSFVKQLNLSFLYT